MQTSKIILFIIIVGIAIFIYSEFFYKISNQNMLEKDITQIKSGQAVLAVKLYPKENAETIILLHGGPGVPDEMMEIVEVLKQKYQVINFEQRGVGNSICKNCQYSMEEYISDIDAIAKEFNLEKFHIFGHSWGGLYAQIYAEKNPEKIKSLFLVSPGSGTNTLWKKVGEEVMDFNKNSVSSFGWMKMGINSLLGMLGSDKAYGRLFKQVVENYNKGYDGDGLSNEVLNKIKAESISKTGEQIAKYKMLDEFENPNFPVIVTYGDGDIYGESKKEVYDRFKTGEFKIINNSGHFPWKHNPKVFRSILMKFYNL